MTTGIGLTNTPRALRLDAAKTGDTKPVAPATMPRDDVDEAVPAAGGLGLFNGLPPVADAPPAAGSFKLGEMARTKEGGFVPPQVVGPSTPGVGGMFGGPGTVAPPPVPAEGTPRAQAALQSAARPASDHPMAVHAAEVRERLAAEGLPTTAEGSQVHVLGENPYSLDPEVREHGSQIARTIAGPAGLAQGADLHLADQRSGPFFPPPGATFESQTARIGREMAVNNGTASYDDAMSHGVDRMETMVHNSATELEQLRGRLPADRSPRTVIASMSWGQSPFRVGLQIANTAIDQGNESQLVRDVNARRAAAGEDNLDVTSPQGAARFRGAIIEGLVGELDSPESKARMDSARGRLANEAKAARDAGILPIAAAGNEHAEGLPAGWDQSGIAGVPGILAVGAADIGDPTTPDDDVMGGFSSQGASVAAPGVNMPVGAAGLDGAPQNVQGTSFAAPYTASVGALMIRANPDISPDQLHQILTSAEATTDLGGTTRDGAGLLDPVAAVRMARALRD